MKGEGLRVRRFVTVDPSTRVQGKGDVTDPMTVNNNFTEGQVEVSL